MLGCAAQAGCVLAQLQSMLSSFYANRISFCKISGEFLRYRATESHSRILAHRKSEVHRTLDHATHVIQAVLSPACPGKLASTQGVAHLHRTLPTRRSLFLTSERVTALSPRFFFVYCTMGNAEREIQDKHEDVAGAHHSDNPSNLNPGRNFRTSRLIRQVFHPRNIRIP